MLSYLQKEAIIMEKETKLYLEVEKIGVPLIDALSTVDKKSFALELLMFVKDYYKDKSNKPNEEK